MRFYLLTFLIFCSVLGWGTPRIFFNYKIYYTIDHQPYIETAIQFSSATMKFIANDSGYLQANLEITQIFKKNDQIVKVDKYVLSSPEMKDSVVEDFFDMQRFLLPPDDYEFEMVIKDLNSNELVEGSFEIKIPPLNGTRLELSELGYIQKLKKSAVKDNFTKNGYQLIPYFTNYFPPVYDKIAYYLEMYNSDVLFEEGEMFAATFKVKDLATDEILEDYFQYKKLKPAKIIPILNILPIGDLPSGEYEIVISIVDKDQKTLMEKNVLFKRRNDLMPAKIGVSTFDLSNSFATSLPNDSLSYFLASLMPISRQYEYEQIREMLVENDTVYMKKFFHAYWGQTAPDNPTEAWLKYKRQVLYTEKMFGTQIRRGYDSDRGRIHLKYGSPNFVTDEANGTSAFPYQIWQYYKIGIHSNVRFIFYNPELATNEYPLLHSDLPEEITNTNWQYEILKRNNSNVNQTIKGNSGIFFEN